MKHVTASNLRRSDRRVRPWSLLLLVALAALALASAAPAVRADDAAAEAKFKQIKWTNGPVTADLGSIATLKVPDSYQFTDAVGSRLWMELNGNFNNDKILGIIMPKMGPGSAEWFVVFQFDDIGYVKDDEKGSLDSETTNAILDGMRKGTEAANAQRVAQGFSAMHVDGWQQSPFYDNDTHNLTWAVRGSSKEGVSINYDSRILGRRGAMKIKMIASPGDMATAVPKLKTLMGGMQFKPSERYDEYRSGDKIAQYGLVGLITGGAAVAIAKSSKLLIKLGVFIVAAIVGIGAKIKSFFSRKA